MKELTYYITKNDVSPKEIKDCGFAGEHLATRIIFNLSEEFLDQYNYYLQIVTAGGEVIVTDQLILSEGKIIYDIPNRVTAISGICSLQLMVKEGERVNFLYPIKLRFLGSGEKTSGAINYLSEIADALNTCKNAAKKADDLADMTQEFLDLVGNIELALDDIIELEEYYIGGNGQ